MNCWACRDKEKSVLKESPLVNALKRVVSLLDEDGVMLSSIQTVKDSEQLNGNKTLIEVQITVLVTPDVQVQEHL
jgi:hypothetical protein